MKKEIENSSRNVNMYLIFKIIRNNRAILIQGLFQIFQFLKFLFKCGVFRAKFLKKLFG
jgi:hypothetical protein